jgi:hypothetical protein
MQTPSHFLLTAVLARTIATPTAYPIHRVALLLGAVLPDIPFSLLTVVYEIYYRWFAMPPTGGSIMEYLHFDLFFTDPVWIVGHNFFHSLVINLLLLALGYGGMRRGWRGTRPLFWLGVGMLFHTLLDVVTHHSDGPLLFFPLNWTYRFPSPISYWEPDYFGRLFTIFEFAINTLIVVYFGWAWRTQKKG